MKQEKQLDSFVSFMSPIRTKDDRLLQSILENRIECFSDSNLWERFLETHRVCFDVLNRPELRDFIANGLEYASVADFAKAFGNTYGNPC